MLLRYGTSEDGRIEKKAHIYTQAEHGIDPHKVDPDALWVVRLLRKEGFHAYVVGGAVRDLLISRHPNDFDVATDAHPQRIRRIFRSARIIGRRFRIVHVYCGREKFIEVTTFRSRVSARNAAGDAQPEASLFGTIEEDAERRDFTMNALYYCPVERHVIDYVGGYPDIRARRIRTLIPAEESFAEDPVRMIRAVKYASLSGFPLPLGMAGLIKRYRESLLSCARERVTEEVYKILTTGSAEPILELAHRLRLFEVMFPALEGAIREGRLKFVDTPLAERLRALDQRAREGRHLEREAMFGFLFRDHVRTREDLLADPDPSFLIQQFLRTAAEPLFPSRKDLAVAAEVILREAHPQRRPPAHAPRAGGDAAPRTAADGSPRRRRRRRSGRRRNPRPGPGPVPRN